MSEWQEELVQLAAQLNEDPVYLYGMFGQPPMNVKQAAAYVEAQVSTYVVSFLWRNEEVTLFILVPVGDKPETDAIPSVDSAYQRIKKVCEVL